MRTRVLLFAVLFAAAVSCGKEEIHPLPEGSTTIHYQVTANSAANTRATVNGNMQYVFSEGDRLYMSGTGDAAGKIYGYLDLISGAGTTTASFEGDLAGAEGYTATSSTALSAVLVGSSDALHSASGGVASAPDYDQAVASTFEEAIQKYSHFTAALRFGEHNLILSQHSSFLCCSIKYSKATTPENTELIIKILDSNNEVLRTASVQVSSSLYLSTAEFVTAFPENTDLTGAYLTSQQGSSEPNVLQVINDGESISLAANTYYNIYRTTLPGWDGFRIKATQDDTDVTFNYADQADNIQYSLDLGATWTSYTSVSAIQLNANDEICFRGQRANYKNAKDDEYGTPNNKPIFTATKKCYIAGNIMSLLADKENPVEDAFNGAFSKGSGSAIDYIDIDPKDPLILPATTMAERCYKGMFRKSTSLTFGPDLPATVMAADCYNSMFRDCSSLQSVRCYVSCFIGGENDEYTKANYNRDAIMSWLDKWMDGITTSGNIYCHPDMVEYWKNSKNQSGPWWTTDYQKATMSKNWTASAWESYPN